ncbi:acyltransferase family protein [Janibacter cremeus]|uniref:Peptidoglycan/LPS O-acetylase OafA/YrhL n=1 Tax=Janibacter cremeus TaxID=1285192 RepID=A0A852VT48_9MICO|nr:peptidoglycan/LPS O-acetylase OafA/YrhL [Janibacter cremeus]
MARSRLGYSPALDGVRGLFMLCFMAYHFGVDQLAGMWVCINLFFVLSAFLITRILVEEKVSRGDIDAIAFYKRRARRLLPALFLVLGFIVTYAFLWADETVRRTIGGDVLATLGYVMNWRLIAEGDQYFGTQGGASPLRHAWTLAIEEQFYVLVPFVILALMVLARSRRLITLVLLLGAVVSAVWTAVLGFHDASDFPRVYYGTDARAQALFIGAALGVWLAPGANGRVPTFSRPVVTGAGIVGVVSSVGSFLLVGPYSGWMFNAGGMFFFALGSALLVIACVDARPSWVHTVFGWRPLAHAGRMSYGLYLWHWPIWLAFGNGRLSDSAVVNFAVCAVLTVGVAHLSYTYVERPIIAKGVRGLFPSVRSTSGATAAVVTPIVVLAGTGFAVAQSAPETAGSPPVAAAPAGPPPTVVEGQAEYAPKDPARVGVYGDSVPFYLADRFPAGAFPGVTVHNYAKEGCDLLAEPMSWAPGFQMGNQPECVALKEEWPQQFEQSDDDVLLVFASPLLAVPHVVDGERLWLDDDDYLQLITDRLDTVHDEAMAAGAEQVQLVNVPCRKPVKESIPEEFRVVFDSSPKIVQEYKEPVMINTLVEDWAAGYDDVELIDLHRALCSQGYQEEIDGIEVFNDYLHFSPEATPMIWNFLLGRVSENYQQAGS